MLRTLYCILEKPHLSRYGYLVQKFILLNILLNIFSFLSVELFTFTAATIHKFDYIQNFTVLVFIIEIIARYSVIGYDPKYKGFKGKVKYTFSMYTLIDLIAVLPYFIPFISADIMFIRILRFLRFLRILKLIRMKKFVKKFFSLNAFASSTIAIQIIVLFALSILIVFIFSFMYNSIDKSFLIFMDPTNILEIHSALEIILGIIELVIGLFIGGALISIITSSLVNITDTVKNGYLAYREKDHIIIIGANLMLNFILNEMNKYFYDNEDEQDVVIFLPDIKNIESFKKNLKYYSCLNIVLITGDKFNWNSYERININSANKILILSDEQEDNQNQNIKITKFILSHDKFINDSLEFTIQTNNISYSQKIYEYVFDNRKNKYLLIDNNDVMGKFLNRSIVNSDYFKVFSELLSFDGYEFYLIDSFELFEKEITFLEVYIQFTEGVPIGIVQNNKILLNPDNQTVLSEGDKIISILENAYSFDVDVDININSFESLEDIKKPKIKEKKKICIIGNYDDIKINDISQFLTDESIKNSINIGESDNNYMKDAIWDNIIKNEIDIIILNLEDEDEFTLTLYLQSVYKNNHVFLSKIVNILHNPTTAFLLTDKQNNNMILSEKLIGEYIVQTLFSPFTVKVFNEITQKEGSEFYIINKSEYYEIFKMDYLSVKKVLAQNNMLYIGAFIDENFDFNNKEISNSKKILVLASGE